MAGRCSRPGSSTYSAWRATLLTATTAHPELEVELPLELPLVLVLVLALELA